MSRGPYTPSCHVHIVLRCEFLLLLSIGITDIVNLCVCVCVSIHYTTTSYLCDATMCCVAHVCVCALVCVSLHPPLSCMEVSFMHGSCATFVAPWIIAAGIVAKCIFFFMTQMCCCCSVWWVREGVQHTCIPPLYLYALRAAQAHLLCSTNGQNNNFVLARRVVPVRLRGPGGHVAVAHAAYAKTNTHHV